MSVSNSTATRTTVATSTVSATLLAANMARKMATVVNDSLQILYVALGSTASSTAFDYKLLAGQTLELPIIGGDDVYRGVISGILDAATGNARVSQTLG